MAPYYELQLTILTVFCVISLLLERHVSNKTKENQAGSGHGATSAAVAALTKQYLIVYAIVMGADWLQGPYVYSLYREQYGFPERIVAVLFVTGFMSAGLAAPLIGAWADKHGRKRMCMIFCISYTLACVCILIPSLPILFLGRLMGGVSTSILFSAFESWLISDSSSKNIPQADLSNIMGRATLVNGFVATAAGVASNQLVSSTESFASPFVTSGGLLVLAWFVIGKLWTENYGAGGGTSSDSDLFQVTRLGQAWKIVRQDPVLLVLGLTQTCFEGSMYLFVFLWVPSLQESKPSLSPPLPLGYIFSCFMVSMMLGSLLYTSITSYSLHADSSIAIHAKLSSLVCAVSALALAISVKSHDEHVRFWAFCAFEACVGMYYPVQGMLRGTLISNEHRATLSSLFRVPLNIFVVVSLLTGVSSARQAVLTASSLMLAFSSIMTGSVVLPRVERQQPHEPPLSAEERLA
ncbi:DUF791-domain-containing protein [Heliocybe sulcata]|uniref:Molybdate-anion transporter n=1 Tax=Heliocybe sulcata TaxID=5364 RepID=A0A5C3N581_9AGAM|nr:DUF791-domain-containing protein [Heliocybe sulcata]